jgi:nitroreductase
MGDDQACDVVGLMETCSTIRYFRPGHPGAEDIEFLLHAASLAHSPMNVQPWAFVVVDDAAMLRSFSEGLEARAAEMVVLAAGTADPSLREMYRGGTNLMRSLGRDVSVVVFVCMTPPPQGFPDEFVHAAVFAAAQNMLLAARSRGLATAYTTFHTFIEPLIRRSVGLPDDVAIMASIPVGYSAHGFFRLRRRPLTESTHRNHW